MGRCLALLLILGAGVWPASARELDDLPGVLYSDASPPYAVHVAPQAEIPPPLSADGFKAPMIRRLYETAFLLRRLFLQLPCYCGCEVTAEHKSLYACYVAPVGAACYSAECAVCLSEAQRAEKLNEEGFGVEDIRGVLEAEFGD